MILSGSVTFGQTVPSVQAEISFNLADHTYAVRYWPAAGDARLAKTVIGNIPGALLTNLTNHCIAIVNAQEGISASVLTP
jgi:hypothetical protein